MYKQIAVTVIVGFVATFSLADCSSVMRYTFPLSLLKANNFAFPETSVSSSKYECFKRVVPLFLKQTTSSRREKMINGSSHASFC